MDTDDIGRIQRAVKAGDVNDEILRAIADVYRDSQIAVGNFEVEECVARMGARLLALRLNRDHIEPAPLSQITVRKKSCK